MKTNINKLITYANQRKLLDERDNPFMYNTLCYLLDVSVNEGYCYEECNLQIDDLLEEIACAYSPFETQVEKELFKSKIIGTVIERPSIVETKFNKLCEVDPKLATDYLYKFAKDVNYIKARQIEKNIKYQVDSKYGKIDITINLSKPEKSTKEIELLSQALDNKWPPCFLCKEQEGLYGSLKNPDRSNHRLISLDLNGSKWFLQYSPYSYFQEHAIVLSSEHRDMKINRETFDNLIEFVNQFPHYMIGSNADIPVVGGSMLTHDHYQAGNYEFSLFRAKTKLEKKINNVQVHSVVWPMHTVKLISTNSNNLLDVAELVLNKWIAYEDVENGIYKYTNERHNTITPIVRKENNRFEMYLILRNNYTNLELPSGVFHVDKSRHNIKRENIGLIEAMGLAILPSRLKNELKIIASSEKLPSNLSYHQQLFDQMIVDEPSDRLRYLYNLTGEIYVECLADCGVFKFNEHKYIEFIKRIDE